MNLTETSDSSDFADNDLQKMLPFEDFLRLLSLQGFEIGVGTHLRIQALLNQLSPNCSQARLKQLMRPLICTTPEEQGLFEGLFDNYFTTHMPKPFGVATSPVKKRVSTSIENDGEDIDNWKRNFIDHWAKITATLILLGAGLYYIGTKTIIKPADAVLLEGPFFGDTRLFEYIGYSLLAVAVLTVLFLIYQDYNKRLRNRRLALDSERLRKPMLHWKIEVPATTLSMFSTQSFYRATNLLKSREQTEGRLLNIPKSIRASIANMGFPKLQYGFRTQPSEFLVLIDRASYRDHQATYFETLFQSLESQEIFAVRYFFREQPARCWDEDDQGIDLETLFKKYHSHRLIIMGDAHRLLDPFSGKLPEDLSALHLWKYKAVLSAKEAPPYIVNKLNDEGNFVVLKASVDNLLSLQDVLEMSVQGEYNNTREGEEVNTALEYLSAEEIIKNLKKNLDELTFEWVAVCAVYPELNWQFTLYLGHEIFGEDAVTENRLLALVQLPWYRDGLIPDKLRTSLINTLSEKRLEEVRAVILNWLKNHPPQIDNKQVKDEYELYIAMEASMLDPDNEEKKRWLQNLISKPEQGNSRYKEIVLRYLEQESDKERVLALPAWVRGLFGVRQEKEALPENDLNAPDEYIYPRVQRRKRIFAKITDWLVYLAFISLLDILLSIDFNNQQIELLVFRGIIALFFVISIDSLIGGIGKRLFGLARIDTRTNELVSFRVNSIRCIDAAIFQASILFNTKLNELGLANFIQLIGYITLLIFVVYFLINLYYAGKANGFLIADIFANTQVVNRSDFLAGRYLRNKKVEKPEALKPIVEIQKTSKPVEPDVPPETESKEKQEEEEETLVTKAPAKFYSKDDILVTVMTLAETESAKAMLLFQTRKQQTWLVASGRELFCLLDNADSGNARQDLLRWRYPLEGEAADLYINIKPNKTSKNTGFLDVGNHRNWYYTLRLHPDPKELEIKIRSLFFIDEEQEAIELESALNSIAEELQAESVQENVESEATETSNDSTSASTKRIYISSASEDKEYRRLVLRWLGPLVEEGLIAYFDPSTLDRGRNWQDMIEERIAGSDIFILLGSKAWEDSPFAKEELKLIRNQIRSWKSINELPINALLVPVRPMKGRDDVFNDARIKVLNSIPISERNDSRMAYSEIVQQIRKWTLPSSRPATILELDGFKGIKEQALYFIRKEELGKGVSLISTFLGAEINATIAKRNKQSIEKLNELIAQIFVQDDPDNVWALKDGSEKWKDFAIADLEEIINEIE